MKLAEARELKAGTEVMWHVGNGWYMAGEFVKITKVTKFPSMTFNDLMRGDFDLSKGKEELMCLVKHNDKGKERTATIRPRRLQVVEEV